MKTCPVCMLIHLEGEQMCECGFDFTTFSSKNVKKGKESLPGIISCGIFAISFIFLCLIDGLALSEAFILLGVPSFIIGLVLGIAGIIFSIKRPKKRIRFSILGIVLNTLPMLINYMLYY